MKTIVFNEKDATRVPFLRGILIRSLLDAGLEFEEALELATAMRDRLSDTAEISNYEIRLQVSAMLEESGHLGAMEPYRLPLGAPVRIQVDAPDGSSSAFSRAEHERFLQGSGGMAASSFSLPGGRVDTGDVAALLPGAALPDGGAVV